MAAHWRYKEGHLGQEDLVKKLAWVRQVLEWQEDLETAAPFVDLLKADIFGDQVLVFTPQGEVIDLPRGATPLDFAYRIHTEVGHGCIGAKVNGRLVPLKRELESGDTVEILTSKSGKGPSRGLVDDSADGLCAEQSAAVVQAAGAGGERGVRADVAE